ncbi:hypothetical protein AYO20_02858 [Fonsecaea nubica]|uniref:Transcription factor IIIC subunit Tfc1/Sfc1 triple barrel domain-containing protein n=1 Tax=Fonsecaea nubica TaxID=856822 RepID=A0A178DA95_9EURO|nr:hypothetical protein AYO20_02858 [Fonsecaea nubica]OAL38025.1 hypothetical protein AYO20_02858 [Fonsecaea nubica]
MPHGPSNGETAPSFQVPRNPILSIEHPCIVKNVEKAVDMLGGPAEIVQSLESGLEKPLGLKFQPEGPSSRAVLSYNKPTNNVLLKVTVPKRTGRKRRRGFDEQFSEDSGESRPRKDVKHLLRSLTDNRERCEVEVVGQIGSTHVWRAMPDFTYSSKGSSFLGEVQSELLPQQYPLLKQWSFPGSSPKEDTEVVPPPVLSTQNLPANFTYCQETAADSMVEQPSANRMTDETVQHSTS